MSDQIEWLKDWHLRGLGTAINGDDSNLRDFDNNSPFRMCYKVSPQGLFNDNSAFAVIGLSVETLQSQARSLGQTVKYGGLASLEEYKDFMDSVSLFN